MAQPKIKVTQMPAALTLNATDSIMIIQSGTNKKSTVSTFLKNLNSIDTIRVNPVQNAINFTVATKNDANAIAVIGSTGRIGFGTSTPESKVHVAGNLQVGSTTSDGITVQSSETVTYTAADQTSSLVKSLSPNRAMTAVNCNTGVSSLLSLPNGSNAQIKTIVQNTLDAGKTSTLSFTGLGGNTVTFNNAGESVTLQYVSLISKWIVLSIHGAILSTV